MKLCEDCAMRLFNKKHYNLQGTGNPYFGKCIIVPNVDYSAYKLGDMSYSKQVEIILQCLSLTGELDNLYILPLLRCNEVISCKVTNDIFNRCVTYFANDLKRYNFKDILLLGDAARKFLNCDITSNLNNILISSNNRRYYVNYSPFVKYVSDDLFEIFQYNLQKWYYSVNNKNFSNYNNIYMNNDS